MGRKKVGEAFSLGPGRILVTLSMQRWWLGAVVAVLWPLSSWGLLAWTEGDSSAGRLWNIQQQQLRLNMLPVALGSFWRDSLDPFFLGGPGNNYRRRQWYPTAVLLPGKSHGQRRLVGCSPWGREELGTTEQLHFHFSLSCTGEGNGNPLQCSCLENPRDGTTVYFVRSRQISGAGQVL